MRTTLPLLLLVVAGLALGAPAASAQGFQAAATLNVTPPSEELTSGVPLNAEGTVRFTGDILYSLNLHGIPVEYKITAAPAWTSVIVSPSNDIIPLNIAASPTVTGARPFVVSILMSDEARPGEVGIIEITATLRPQQPGAAPFSVSTSVPVQASAEHGDDCPEHATATQAASPAKVDALAQPAAAPAADEEQPLYVQTGGVTPLTKAWYALAGFGLVGAGVGFVMWRRRSA